MNTNNIKHKYSNPITGGWYADPECRKYDGKYYIFVTQSFSDYNMQKNIDCFITYDFKKFELKRNIINMEQFPEFENACWAPTEIQKGEYHYLVFAINDIQSSDELGGLVIARAKNPEGPYERFSENLLVDKFINKAQPIDAHLFKDDDGTIYLYYGGWGYLNVCEMKEDMTGLNHDNLVELKLPSYVEAPCVFKRNDNYYIMYSTGGWTNETYSVIIGRSKLPTSEFHSFKKIMSSSDVAVGPGHNSYIEIDNQLFTVYHRRYANDIEAGNRYLAIDLLEFDGDEPMEVELT